MARDNLWIWLDLEMTGLDPDNHKIIEIATVITDYDLNIIATGPELVVKQPKDEMAKMDKWCVNQHTRSGLVERVEKDGILDASAEQLTLDFLKEHVKPKTSPMCGNSICQDRRFLYRYMPKLESFFHYRNLDVSTLKLLAKAYGSKVTDKIVKNMAHRALGDVIESIDEMKLYKDEFIKI
ncbi:MAG: oligoribonuclease [Francisellaceae bacterium]|jgi:oligoribonuclease|nr:oligoribonuclease [Francisellaceae bacterium]MBT6208335.1 oligoribonuclease [Francisellaceae bacterium]MBT6539379.1 oligoribonuclease [Francisellaceae bacterium]